MDPKPDVPKVQEMGISYKFPLSDAKRKKNLKEEQSSEEHEKQKSSTHGGFRVTVTEKAKDKLHNLKKQISQQRGRAIRVLYNTFPKKRDRADSQQVEEAQTIPGETYPPIYPKMRESWQAVTPEKLAEDIHRLIYRVTVRTSGITNILFSPPPKENRGSTYQAAEAVLNLVKVLARRLETPEKTAEVIANCADMLKDVSESTELSQFNRQVFEMLGDTSKVLRVLRCVHQSIVLKPYGILRTVVVKNKMTKDVRSDDGWRIMITIAHEDLIIVKHVRREQSMDLPTKAQPDKEQNHWEYEWEVCLLFDKDMCDMTGSRLSITKLELHQGMDKELQRELKDMMQNGNLKVF